VLQAQDEHDVEGKANKVAMAIVLGVAPGEIGGGPDIAGLIGGAGRVAGQALRRVGRRRAGIDINGTDLPQIGYGLAAQNLKQIRPLRTAPQRCLHGLVFCAEKAAR